MIPRNRFTLLIVICSMVVLSSPVLAQSRVHYGKAFSYTGQADTFRAFRFRGAANTRISVNVQGQCVGGQQVNPRFSIDDPDGQFVVFDDNSGDGCQSLDARFSDISISKNGLYTLNIWIDSNSPSGRVTIRLTCESGNCPTSSGGSGRLPPANLLDGRINNMEARDIAAPVAVYPDPLDVYAVNPQNGDGLFALRITPQQVQAALSASRPALVGASTNPFSAFPIEIYLLASGELQLNTYYADGKPYVISVPIHIKEMLAKLDVSPAVMETTSTATPAFPMPASFLRRCAVPSADDPTQVIITSGEGCQAAP